jgi:co-chaperonin GroES (HSP10)
MLQNFAHGALYEFQTIDEAFPGPEDGCDPLCDPFPHVALLQIRRAKNVTAGGIALPDEVMQAEAANTQVAKVLAVGANCFKHPDSRKPWSEGPWFEVGDYLRIPRFNGFRFSVKWKVPKKWNKDQRETIEDVGFVCFEPIQIVAKVRGDPRAITSYA